MCGLGLTFLAVEYPPNFGVVSTGPWITRPGIGSTGADPYSRALMAARGEVPMAAAEGVMLTATTDSAGRNLDLSCRYTIRGSVPAASYWTVTVYRSPTMTDGDLRQSFTSSEALLAENGTVEIHAAPDPQPGNWLPLQGRGRFSLYLRLYETQLSSTALALERSSTPAIERGDCL
jgi:hypothetical protein